jgi:hypothetical protein
MNRISEIANYIQITSRHDDVNVYEELVNTYHMILQLWNRPNEEYE